MKMVAGDSQIENLRALRAFEVSSQKLPRRLEDLQESPSIIFMRMGAHFANE
jgi:hypothetical protein